jgi:hypothetical protein
MLNALRGLGFKMKDKIVSHVKFTIKEGYVSDFLAAQAELDSDPLF